MKRTEYPIVVIDEQRDQLEEIEAAFVQSGEKCTLIQYDPFYRGEPYSGIELLFLDLNLNPAGGQSNTSIYSFLEAAIVSYVSNDNGPFVLVFWTSRPELVEGFKQYVGRDKEAPLYSFRPIYVTTLPKEDFQLHPRESLDAILNEPIVKLVFSLHKKLLQASTTAFNDLIGCVPLTEEWGDNDGYLDVLKKVFTKIAIASVGKHNAVSIPDKAVYEVVGREVLHQLTKNSNNEWKSFLSIDDKKVEEVKIMTFNDWQYKLNTVFHVETHPLSCVDRGTVLTGKKLIFDGILGMDIFDWYKEEFLLSKDFGADYQIVPVATEISPSCDYAQGNPRLFKYVLGVCWISKKRPSKGLETGETPPFKKRDKHVNLPSFLIDGRYYKISLSFNYVVGLRWSIAKWLNPIFTLREEMVNKISSMVADYCSRIGILDVNEK